MKYTIIGAANVDIMTRSKAKIIHGDSNPAEVSISAGGVARNIAESLARHRAKVNFITAVGDDPLGNFLKEGCEACGINTSAWIIRQNTGTGVYSAAIDSDGELYTAFNAMTVQESIKISEITQRKDIIKTADLLIAETNLTEKILKAVFDIRGELPVMVDAVSAVKTPRIENMLSRISLLKLNRLEAERLTGLTLDTKEKLKHVCYSILNRGVLRVFITLGIAGVCAADRSGVIFVPAQPVAVRNVTGAGDAFSAGVALRFNEDLRTQAEYGTELAALHLRSNI